MMEYIGQNIKYYRKLNKLTQEELATKTNLSKNTIWNYESNKKNNIPPIETLNALSKVFNIPMTKLLEINHDYEEEFQAYKQAFQNGNNKLWQQIIDADSKNQLVMEVKADGNRPSYANKYAAGLDIRASIDSPITIKSGEVAEVPTKLAVAIPNGCFGLVTIRSGLGFKHGITLINNVGIIDEDYRGYIGIKLVNNGKADYTIIDGDRVAQMIIIPYIQPAVIFVDKLNETQRGKRGFGSSGR